VSVFTYLGLLQNYLYCRYGTPAVDNLATANPFMSHGYFFGQRGYHFFSKSPKLTTLFFIC